MIKLIIQNINNIMDCLNKTLRPIGEKNLTNL